MKKLQFEIKNLEEALDYASKELRIKKDYISIEVLEKKSMLKLKMNNLVEASVNIDPAEVGYNTLVDLFQNMEIETQIEMKRDNFVFHEFDDKLERFFDNSTKSFKFNGWQF